MRIGISTAHNCWMMFLPINSNVLNQCWVFIGERKVILQNRQVIFTHKQQEIMTGGEVRSNKRIINNTEFAHSTYICYSLLH